MRYVVVNGTFYYIVHDLVDNSLVSKFVEAKDADDYAAWRNGPATFEAWKNKPTGFGNFTHWELLQENYFNMKLPDWEAELESAFIAGKDGLKER